VFTQALKHKAGDIEEYRRAHGWAAPGNYAVRNKYVLSPLTIKPFISFHFMRSSQVRGSCGVSQKYQGAAVNNQIQPQSI
jgi:hypothetical protein